MRELEQTVVQVLAEFGVAARVSWAARLVGWIRVDVVTSRLPPLGVALALARRLGVSECWVAVTRGMRWMVMVGWPVED